ncbi:MAG: non-ribosomal peptide synthetase, partial [Marivirga sp.]|nr:non-ribosomal peptide synthetase [Marivirga sp.]
EKKLSQIDILSVDERNQLLCDFNNTTVDYPLGKSIIDQFEEQVMKTPDNLAVVYDDDKITYAELNNRANWIAHRMADEGMVAHQRIALLFFPSIEMVVAILAILKNGGTYVPISTETPYERIKYILSDCDAGLLLTQSNILSRETPIEQSLKIDHLIVDFDHYQSTGHPNPERKNVEADVIYVIYTSGSTGKPKGVEVRDSGIHNTVAFYKELFLVKEKMKVSQVANIGFDAAALEMWSCFLSGCCLHIAPQEVRLNPDAMHKWLFDNSIEVTFQVPVIAEYLLKRDPCTFNRNLRNINIGGDKLNYFPDSNLPFKVCNLYGPTEDSIWTTWAEMDCKGGRTTYIIGKPIANKQVYILDNNNKLQPIGVPGELCISGAGVAKGYLNNEMLTSRKFLLNPFKEGELMYKTGDLARWLSDGNIEFLGRMDDQVKIRGFRIELREIESQLSSHALITDSIVVTKGDDGNKCLVGYYVSEKAIATSELRSYLSPRLPNYMIPHVYVHLKSLPLTSNGKVDRNALPVPESAEGEDYVAPTNDIEKQLVEIWSEVLKTGKENISISKSFFELGGNSINLLNLNKKIEESLEKHITIPDLFRYPTIQSIVKYMNNEEDRFNEDDVKTEIESKVSEMKNFINIISNE